eukprot:7091401-Prymnesium_polylepis.1
MAPGIASQVMWPTVSSAGRVARSSMMTTRNTMLARWKLPKSSTILRPNVVHMSVVSCWKCGSRMRFSRDISATMASMQRRASTSYRFATTGPHFHSGVAESRRTSCTTSGEPTRAAHIMTSKPASFLIRRSPPHSDTN